MSRYLTILTYHRVLPDALFKGYLFPSLAVSESMFERQMAVLAARCSVVTIEEGLREIESGRSQKKPLVAVTFDDGYADNILVAAPIMGKHGIRATFFVVAGFVGTDAELWYDIAARKWEAASVSHLTVAVSQAGAKVSWKGGEKPSLPTWMALLKSVDPELRDQIVMALPDPGPVGPRQHLDRLMSQDELRQLKGAGHEVASHSMSHPLLPQLEPQALEAELVHSRRLLELWLQGEVRGFSYPNGDYDDRVKEAVVRAGCTYACTSRHGRNRAGADPLRLHRIDMHPARSSGLMGEFDESSFRAAVSLLHPYPGTT